MISLKLGPANLKQPTAVHVQVGLSSICNALLTALSTYTEHVDKLFVCLGSISLHGASSPTLSIHACVAHAYEA